jgi:AraC family transcriptional activator of pobA
MGKNIPIYSINQFKKEAVKKRQFQVEVFNKDRNFKVEYPHRHDNFYEVLFITQGSGSYTIDFKTYSIFPNHVFFVSPGQVHSIDFSDDILGYIFLFTKEFYLLPKTEKNKLIEFPFFHNLTHENPPLLIPEPQKLIDIFDLLCQHTLEETTNSEEIALAGLDLLLNMCNKYYPQQKEEESISKGRILVKRFKRQIEENFAHQHLVKEYATSLNVTPNHLNETVRQITGFTAKDLIKERIILEAKRLLSHTELNITEIALRLNFEDQSYFSRFYKKNTGSSPNEFRKQ